jgi:hypothetical protein
MCNGACLLFETSHGPRGSLCLRRQRYLLTAEAWIGRWTPVKEWCDTDGGLARAGERRSGLAGTVWTVRDADGVVHVVDFFANDQAAGANLSLI